MRNLLVFGGLSHPNLARAICRNLTCNEGVVILRRFSNGETSIELRDSVRGKDIFLVQSGCGNVNDTFIELLIMIAACKSASAERVTAVLPLFPYSRQPDVAHKGRVPNNKAGIIDATVSESGYKQWISQNGTLIANLLTTAGADRVITMDLHDPQFQGFFNIPVDNLYLNPLLKHYIMDYIPNYHDCVIVSPDSGGAKRATALADAIGCSFALIHKERRARAPDQSAPPTAPTPAPVITAALPMAMNRTSTMVPDRMVATMMLVGDVRDRVCVLVDDIVDTSRTLTRAAELLKDQGAKYIYALVTHGVFSGDAIDRIISLPIDKVITTNSVPQTEHALRLQGRFQVLDVSRILAEAVRRIHNGELVLMLFDHGW